MARRYFGELRDRLIGKNKDSSNKNLSYSWVKVSGIFLHPNKDREYLWEDPRDYLSNFLNPTPPSGEGSTYFSGSPMASDPFADEEHGASGNTPADPDAFPAAHASDVGGSMEINEELSELLNSVHPDNEGEDSLMHELMDAGPWEDDKESVPVETELFDKLPDSDAGWQFPQVDELKLEVKTTLMKSGIDIGVNEIEVSPYIIEQLNEYHMAGKKELATLALWEEVRAEKERLISLYQTEESKEPRDVNINDVIIDVPVVMEEAEHMEEEEKSKPSKKEKSLFDPINGTLDIRSEVRTGNNVPPVVKDQPRVEFHQEDDEPNPEMEEEEAAAKTSVDTHVVMSNTTGDGSQSDYSLAQGAEADASDSLLFSPTFINAISSMAGEGGSSDAEIGRPRKINAQDSGNTAEETDVKFKQGLSSVDNTPDKMVNSPLSTPSPDPSLLNDRPQTEKADMPAEPRSVPPQLDEDQLKTESKGPEPSDKSIQVEDIKSVAAPGGTDTEQAKTGSQNKSVSDLSEEMPVLSRINARDKAKEKPAQKEYEGSLDFTETDQDSPTNVPASSPNKPASQPVQDLNLPRKNVLPDTKEKVRTPKEDSPIRVAASLVPNNEKVSLEKTIETLAFVAEDPVPLRKIGHVYAEVAGQKVPPIKKIESIVEALNARYESNGSPFRIKIWAEGIRMVTIPEVSEVVRQLYDQNRPKKLSRTLMETLAIVAYSQPTTKPEIDFVRGVDSDYAVRKLLEMGLIDIVGRGDSIGRPLLYGTSARFLEQFGLSNLDALPKLREIEELLDDPAFSKERLHLLALEDGESGSSEKDIAEDEVR